MVAKFLLALGALFPTSLAAPTTRTTYPFNKLVAFGDELSDNGNGSYAHGITGDPKTVYGFGTWTNGPVAVSYLSDLLKAPLTDYAFGSSGGGGEIGATFDNLYTKSGAGAASLMDQIANYTGTSDSDIKDSLQFVWVGQNDLSLHTDAFWEGDLKNAQFANEASTRTTSAVKRLMDAGAPYVLVANIYPKHIAPVTAHYLCGTNAGCVSTWGKVIGAANTAIKKGLEQFGEKVIYFDSFSSITSLVNTRSELGFTAPITDFCDGMGDRTWNDCMVQGNVGKYFWMNFVQPTTRAHELIAKDMKKTVDEHFGVK